MDIIQKALLVFIIPRRPRYNDPRDGRVKGGELRNIKRTLRKANWERMNAYSRFIREGSSAHKRLIRDHDLKEQRRKREIGEYVRERGTIGGFHLISDSEATNGRVVLSHSGPKDSSIVYRQGERSISLAYCPSWGEKMNVTCSVYLDDTVEWESPYGCMAITEPELERVQADVRSFLSLLECEVEFSPTWDKRRARVKFLEVWHPLGLPQ